MECPPSAPLLTCGVVPPGGSEGEPVVFPGGALDGDQGLELAPEGNVVLEEVLIGGDIGIDPRQIEGDFLGQVEEVVGRVAGGDIGRDVVEVVGFNFAASMGALVSDPADVKQAQVQDAQVDFIAAREVGVGGVEQGHAHIAAWHYSLEGTEEDLDWRG